MDRSHFLLIPFAELGHLNPMLSLAARLAALGCKVTFVTSDRKGGSQRRLDAAAAADHPTRQATSDGTVKVDPWTAANSTPDSAGKSVEYDTAPSQDPAATLRQRSVRQVQSTALRNSGSCVDAAAAVRAAPPQYLDNLRFVTIADLAYNDTTDPAGVAAARFEALKKKMDSIDEQKTLIAKIIEDARASPDPISCVIHDIHHVRWVREVVTAHGVRSAVLSPGSTLSFLVIYLAFTGRGEKIQDICASSLGMPGGLAGASNGLISRRVTPEAQLQMRNYLSAIFQGIEDAGPYLLNSFRELEASLIPPMEALGLGLRFIGPCLPPWNQDDAGGVWSHLVQKAGCIYEEDEACLAWLDAQEEGSVVFVSFGSEGTLEKNQVEEIAMGIQDSAYKFLWVVRSDGPSPSQFFYGNERGMFVSWAPQRRVLQHPSVGGFLTHCGWSSVLESINFGVPMLCLPLEVDQPMNASFVHSYLQGGVWPTIREDGLIHREDVSDGIRAIMQGRFSEGLSKYSRASQSALKENADREIAAFVQAMI